MKFVLIPFVLLLCASVSTHADVIFYDPGLCDFHKRVCANIRVSFDINSKVMEISGRLYKPDGEGTLKFHFTGITPLDEAVNYTVDIEVKGIYNEILRAKLQPPYSNETLWSLQEMVFDPYPN